jgi:hypothetical protein
MAMFLIKEPIKISFFGAENFHYTSSIISLHQSNFIAQAIDALHVILDLGGLAGMY